ncbi:hypothetical protein [uncultured Vagococcus sp.]|uniref:hypothetical protein n=1 Tax=uncultured Vagococcus sp. TaxID=189676 RepID=UPI002582FD61|nr:hypothetical protein [uncultured Vagococcus sp.]
MFFKVNVNNPTKHKVFSQTGAVWIIIEPRGPFNIALHECSFEQWKEIEGKEINFESLDDTFFFNGCEMSIYKA